MGFRYPTARYPQFPCANPFFRSVPISLADRRPFQPWQLFITQRPLIVFLFPLCHLPLCISVCYPSPTVHLYFPVRCTPLRTMLRKSKNIFLEVKIIIQCISVHGFLWLPTQFQICHTLFVWTSSSLPVLLPFKERKPYLVSFFCLQRKQEFNLRSVSRLVFFWIDTIVCQLDSNGQIFVQEG